MDAQDQDIQEALAEVRQMRREAGDICTMTAALTEQYADHGAAWRTGGEKVGRGLAMGGVRAAVNGAGTVQGALVAAVAGAAIVKATSVIGSMIESAGRASAERKREAALRDLRQKRLEMAAIKLPVVERMLPRITKHREKIYKALLMDADNRVKSDALERHQTTQAGMTAFFLGYCEATVGLNRAEFAQAEYAAWRAGRDSSGALLIDESDVRLKAAADLLGASELPSKTSQGVVLGQLTEGAAYILSDVGLCTHFVAQNPSFGSVFRAIATRRALATIVPFGEWRKPINAVYQGPIGRSAPLRSAVSDRVMAVAALGCVCAIALLGWFNRQAVSAQWQAMTAPPPPPPAEEAPLAVTAPVVSLPPEPIAAAVADPIFTPLGRRVRRCVRGDRGDIDVVLDVNVTGTVQQATVFGPPVTTGVRRECIEELVRDVSFPSSVIARRVAHFVFTSRPVRPTKATDPRPRRGASVDDFLQ